MRSRALPIALGIVALTVIAPPAHSTTVYHLDTPALVRGSTGIVIGTVQGTQSHWNESRTAIVTDVTVSVSDVLKGDATSTVTLTQPGGEVDGMRYEIPGSPAFRANEEVLLFLWEDSHGRAQVNGLAQGKFELRTDPASGERVLSRQLPGLAFRDVRSLARVSAGEAASPVPLRLMLREIHRTLEEDGR
jgi:hypothetical protein